MNNITQEVEAVFRGRPPRISNLMDYVPTLVDDPIPPGFVIDLPEKEYVVSSTGDLDENNSTVTDEAFAWYRLTGPSPAAITLCSVQFLFRLGLAQNQTLLDLMNEKLLFVLDYSSFAYVPPGNTTNGSLPKYTMGSIALFKAVNKTNYQKLQLQPVCIQLIANDLTTQLLYPNDADVKWKMAKTVVQSNDANYASLAHLASTHFVIESFLVASYRLLPRGHPLYVLLDKHFEIAAFSNANTVDYYIGYGSILDMLSSASIGPQLYLIAEFTASITAKDMTFPARINERGMDECPSLDYPYRDDGMLLWNAILKWVNDFLGVYYEDHHKVLKDVYLCAWLRELESSTGGNVKWINSTLNFNESNARDSLASLVASIVYIASVEHNAFNFPSRPSVQFTGAFPLALFAGESVIFKAIVTEAEYMSLYPPLEAARLQALLFDLAGTIRYSILGHYDSCITENCTGQYFVDNISHQFYGDPREVINALKSFHCQLDHATVVIMKRNIYRRKPYVEMLPEGILQSPSI